MAVMVKLHCQLGTPGKRKPLLKNVSIRLLQASTVTSQNKTTVSLAKQTRESKELIPAEMPRHGHPVKRLTQ